MNQEASHNANNYKGVMLCSRPNEKKVSDFKKPFCARVIPGQQIGLVPTQKDHPQIERPKPKRLAILNRHKKWLEQFKGNVHKTKQTIEQKAKAENQKFQKIKDQAQADRQRAKKMRVQYDQTASNVLNILDNKPALKSNELTPYNLRQLDELNEKEPTKKKVEQPFKKKDKKEKPMWAMTKDQLEDNEEKEMDDLLDFFQNNKINDFTEDEGVQDLLANLKGKIEKLKQQQNWKQKQVQKASQNKHRNTHENDESDKYSNFSVGNSEGRSVASQKTQKNIEQLRKKKQQQQWDKHTVSQKSSAANVDEKIAKNLADEVLRNYPNMKGIHSNVSIRKLLEAQASKAINEPILRPVISTVVKQKQMLNANNLPYLHRNPAI